MRTVGKDGREWRLGGQADVAWIAARTTIGPTIASAIPPVFEAYATIAFSGDDAQGEASDSALLDLLTERSPNQPWWLGYLDTGAHDVVFDLAPRVTLYTGWRYVVVEAGPAQAGSWRGYDAWRGRLPDLLWSADRSWLVSMLWDDDWRCLGGPRSLVERVLAEPALDARPVGLDEDATPPGHVCR